ncbi:uncharacterized protein [Epargyreus clarus]|uniref:uncharacterized protein n=1 Tax=Epargyreus clarus TaxID=520877 RepID=UPI003C2F1AB6
MRWRVDRRANMISQAIIIFTLLAICTLQTCDGVRRPAQRRKDVSEAGLYVPSPSAESLQAIAQAMGAAGFEAYTEGKALVKRLIPADSQPDLDVVEHQGVIGKAGVDFPALPNIPNTGFNCKNVPTGYYADLETDCQVFHICDTSRKISFLCPNGTIFSQSHLICDWWFKVDCASAPALYESSVEYYSNEQKKSQKISASLSKNSDLQQIGTDTNVRAESRRTPVNIPSTTERLLRHRQRLQNDAPPTTAKATSRSFQALFDINPTQRTQATTAFEKRRKNLVQLISNNFGNVPSRTTAPTFDYTTRRTTIPAGDYNSIREMQVAAETASFAQNQNRQYLQDFNNKNYRPYPVYNPNLTAKPSKSKSNPTLTTLYDIRDKHLIQYTPEATSKRSTLVPYSKSYTTINSKHEPYTRPGVSLLKDFLEKEKNKTLATTTENLAEITPRSDILENYEKSSSKVTIESKSNFESVTKIPLTTRNDKFTDTSSTDRFDTYTSTKEVPDSTTEPSYQERRERLMKKISLDIFGPTQATNEGILTEKYYGDQPNRPGLIVPPSLTPKTLHSLAIYYATALDNLSTTSPPEENDSTTPAFDEYEPIEDGLPPLFSRQTINKYSSLFGQGGDSELLEELRLDPNGTYNELAEDLTVQMSQNPLATSPQIRELAQVFTHALSAYLQDPVQFRKVLSDIRPTHPSFGDMLTATEEPSNTEPTTTVNEDDEEILGFSDDHKTQHHVNSIRDGKALNIGADYTNTDDPTTTIRPATTTTPTTTTEFIPSYSTTYRTPFRCCGRISASYTTSTTPRELLTTQLPFSNTLTPNVNILTNNPSDGVTTDNYKFPRFGGFQNNKLTLENTAYGTETTPTESKPLNDYVEVTNLPTAWGVDISESTVAPSAPAFESKKIRTTTSTFPTTTPVYFTETDSVELENEEELQRAHSQSFIAPQSNSLRQGKQLNIEEKTAVKKPSEDLEAPTLPNDETTTLQTTTQPTTTIKDQTEALTTVSPILSSIFTSPDSEKTTNDFQWPTTFENWQSTYVDPITLNDGLSPSGHEKGLSQIAHQTNTWAFNTATTPTVQYTTTTDPVSSSTINVANVEISTPNSQSGRDERIGRLLRDPTSTEAAQDFTTISDTVVEKAKEIMGGMNATTTEKLMNVMKKTKSKTVKRLILLLVQTCDDDHNSTAEASKKALLEALMAVSQKDMDEIAQEQGFADTLTTASDTEIKTTVYQRRMDRIPARDSFRRGKSLNVDPKAINSLSNPTTTEALKTEETEFTTTLSPRTTIRGRGGKRHQAKPTEQPRTPIDRPFAEARVAPQGADVKTQSDTRAIELLRSLYTIAARWG